MTHCHVLSAALGLRVVMFEKAAPNCAVHFKGKKKEKKAEYLWSPCEQYADIALKNVTEVNTIQGMVHDLQEPRTLPEKLP